MGVIIPLYSKDSMQTELAEALPQKSVVSTPRRAIKWAHSLAHKKVQNEQLKQWMQCMQCEFLLGNLVLVDLKRVNQG